MSSLVVARVKSCIKVGSGRAQLRRVLYVDLVGREAETGWPLR